MSEKEEKCADYIRENYIYEPETGKIYAKPNEKRKDIHEVGWIDARGYVIVMVNRRKFKAHRLAWFLVFGCFPKELDHKDRNKANNKFSNLRECNRSQNKGNVGPRVDNTSGFKNVVWDKNRNKWQARVEKNGKNYQMRFKTKEEAIIAARELRNNLFGEFANE